MYIYIYVHVIIGGIGKTYAAQGKHSSLGERNNKGIKSVYNPRYSRLRIQTIENVIDRIALFMTDMLLEKLLTFPHAVNQTLYLWSFLSTKNYYFLCIVFVDACCQNSSKMISSSAIFTANTQKHDHFFLLWVFVKMTFSLLHFIHNKIYQCSKCKKFRTLDNFKGVLWCLM